jgi:colicin import membrane protein
MMNDGVLYEQDEAFKRMLGFSVAAHVGVALFFLVRIAFFTPEPIDFQAAIRVDMVALPDKVIDDALLQQKKEMPPEVKPAPEVKPEVKPEPKVEPKPEPKVEVKPKPAPKVNLEKPKPDLKSLKKDQAKALEKLKAMEAVDEIMHDDAKPKAKPVTKPVASTTTKGNVIVAGTALKGLNKLDYDKYLGDLDSHVKSNWNLPEWLSKLELKARAVVYLDAQGVVIGRKLILASGNPQFDAYVLKAIDDSSPFPVPPEKFVGMLKSNGIVFGFPD